MTGTIKTGNPTFIAETETTTSGSSVFKNFTVSGSGYIVVSISVQTDTENDYGSTVAIITKNGATLAVCSHRLSSANTLRLAANACIGVPVSNGDIIGTELASTKNGTKTLYRNFLCFGCTVR